MPRPHAQRSCSIANSWLGIWICLHGTIKSIRHEEGLSGWQCCYLAILAFHDPPGHAASESTMGIEYIHNYKRVHGCNLLQSQRCLVGPETALICSFEFHLSRDPAIALGHATQIGEVDQVQHGKERFGGFLFDLRRAILVIRMDESMVAIMRSMASIKLVILKAPAGSVPDQQLESSGPFPPASHRLQLPPSPPSHATPSPAPPHSAQH